MSILNSIFDVVKGGWTGNDVTCIDESAAQHSSIAANNPLKEGDIVYLETDGTFNRADSTRLDDAADVATLAARLASANQFWLVVSGVEDEQYDGLQQGYVGNEFTYVPWKVTAVRGSLMYETSRFVARSYVPGDALVVQAGLLDRNADLTGDFRQYAEAFAYDDTLEKLTATLT